MDDNMTMRLEIARRIYDLDAEVYRVLGSSLGRVFNSDRDMTVRRLANLMGDFTQGHYLRSELALISNMARTIPVKADSSRLMTEYNEILHALDKLHRLCPGRRPEDQLLRLRDFHRGAGAHGGRPQIRSGPGELRPQAEPEPEPGS